MWVLILLAVNMNDTSDVPGKIFIPFHTEIECEKAAAAMSYNLKYDWFKVSALCKKQS
jgi:hypothetical protein